MSNICFVNTYFRKDSDKDFLNVVLCPGSAESEAGSVAMMKIDCQVTDTQIVHIMKVGHFTSILDS